MKFLIALFIVGVLVFLVGLTMFIISIVQKNDKFLFWCLILNLGNVMVNIANISMRHIK